MNGSRSFYFAMIALPVAVSLTLAAAGQSKLYISGAVTNVSGGGLNVTLGKLDEGTFFKFDHAAIDLEYSKRLMGPFSFVTGLSYYNAGYNVASMSFGSASKLKMSYISVPLMTRWNVGNKNLIFIDVGLQPSYLLDAYLKESIVQFNTKRESEGNITQYSNRFYYAWKFQMLIPIHRFIIGFYYSGLIGHQSSMRNLEGHWGLNAQQSTYLLSDGYSDFNIIGLKAGMRIR
jgi:hypothetical protein